MGFPCGSADKESACNAGYLGLIPGLGRSPGEGKGYPLQYSGPENSMDCIIHAVAESDRTEPQRLSLSLLRWLSGKEPPCQCRRGGLDPCQEEYLEEEIPTHSSVLAGNSHGWGSLACCIPWGLKESDTTGAT